MTIITTTERQFPKDCLFFFVFRSYALSLLKKKKNFALQNAQFIPMRVYRLFIKKRECNYIRVFLF